MILSEFRKKYPAYDNVDDETLAIGLHKRFYSDLTFEDFSQRIGLESAQQTYEPTPPMEITPPDHDIDLAPADYPGGLPEDEPVLDDGIDTKGDTQGRDLASKIVNGILGALGYAEIDLNAIPADSASAQRPQEARSPKKATKGIQDILNKEGGKAGPGGEPVFASMEMTKEMFESSPEKYLTPQQKISHSIQILNQTLQGLQVAKDTRPEREARNFKEKIDLSLQALGQLQKGLGVAKEVKGDFKEPVFDDLPVGDPGVLGQAIDVPFKVGREIARSPGAFTEADDDIERKEASISDLGGQAGRKILETLHNAPGPKKIRYGDDEMKPGDIGESLGRMVAEMGVEIPTANIMIRALAGSIGTISKTIQESTTWRMMKVKDRRLVVQSLDEIVSSMEASGKSEAEILKAMKKAGGNEAAFKRFAKKQGIKIEPKVSDVKPSKPEPKPKKLENPLVKRALDKKPSSKDAFVFGREINKGEIELKDVKAAQKTFLEETKDMDAMEQATRGQFFNEAIEFSEILAGKIEGKEGKISLLKKLGELPKDFGSKIKPKPAPKVKPKKVSTKGKNIRTLGGYARHIGGINFLNFKGELKDMPLNVKYLSRAKGGVPIDDAVRQLIDDNWLDPGTTVASFLEQLRTNPKLLSRDRVGRDIGEKKEHELSEQEKQFKKDMEFQPEEPPEGEYVTIRAEDLPEGKEVTLIEPKTARGWDVYEVAEKDPFSITLVDGETIELKPNDKVQILKSDIPKSEKPKRKIKADVIDPSGKYVDWDLVKTVEKDGLTATYYAVYNKDKSFWSWKNKTEIERIRKAEGKNTLNLGQDAYGKVKPRRGDKHKQEGLSLVVEDPKQPGLFASVGKYDTSIKKILYRGETAQAGTYRLGKGLYLTEEPSKAKMYGDVKVYVGAYPKNPLILKQYETIEDWLLKESGERNMRRFNEKYEIDEFVKSKGYDGIDEPYNQEIVNYNPPKEIKTFKTKREAKEYLKTVRKPNENFDSKKGYASTGEYATNVQSVIDLPEIVHIAKGLLKGKYPGVIKQIRAMGGTAKGAFYPSGSGKINLTAALFEDYKQAAATLAHEIGHLIDYLPDKTMARGNILGRLASLKKYMKHSLPRIPGGPGELTAKDRSRIRYQAKKLVMEEGAERWIDEVIRKELPITPENVLSIWNAVADAKMLAPDLYEYIARLDTANKKAIVKDAMRGVVRADLQKFATVIEDKTGKKVKIKLSEKELKGLINQKYADMINEELRKRRLFERDTIMKELKSLTHAWKPFDAAADPNLTKYRYSSVELYADAFSALVNAPGLLKSHAPNFYEGFFNYLEKKPEAKRLYDEVQDMILNGEIDKVLDKRILDGFRRGDKAYGLALNKDLRIKDGLMRELVDTHWALIGKLKKVGESNIPAGENPRYKMEDLVYSGSETEWVMNRVFNEIIKPLEQNSMNWDDFGYELLLRRVAKGDRGEMANTEGLHPARAEKKLKARNARRSQPQLNTMGKAIEAFKELNKYVTDKGIDADRWGPELVKMMQENTDYATYDVVDYIEKRNGAWVSAKIFPQIGTLKEIANPGTATIMKHISMIKAINRQVAAESVVNFLKKHEPDGVKPADKKWNGRFHQIQPPPPNQGLGLIAYLKNGKAQGYYIDKWIAEMFDHNPWESSIVAKLLKYTIQPFRTLFVELNYGFYMNNIIRDYFRAATNLPKAKLTTFLPYWLKGLKPAFRSAYGLPDEVVSEMLQDNMLISIADVRGLSPEDKQIERMLKMYHMKPKSWKSQVIRPFGHFLTYVTNVGRGLERTTKVAGKLYLDAKFPEMHESVKKHIVIHQSGSPSFLTLGRMYPIYNNILMFSNAMKEGYRGDYRAFSRNHKEFMWKKAKYVYLPKMLMYAAKLGLLGTGSYLVMQGVSEYDATNYVTIPLGLTENGKSVYLRVPMDETGRLMGGILWKILNRDFQKMWTGLFDYMAGQAPTLHPGIDMFMDVVDYASGKNPYDSWRGRYAIPEQIFQAGGKRKHEYFLKWLANKSGSTIVYKFRGSSPEEIKTELEKLIQYPFMSNILGRFLKVSDYGITESLRDIQDDLRKTRAGELLDTKQVVWDILNDKKITKEQAALLIKNPDVVGRAGAMGLARKYGMVYMESFLSAQGNEEKAAIISEFLKREELIREYKK